MDGGGGSSVAASAESGMNFAERIMAKMGHEEGQGDWFDIMIVA